MLIISPVRFVKNADEIRRPHLRLTLRKTGFMLCWLDQYMLQEFRFSMVRYLCLRCAKATSEEARARLVSLLDAKTPDSD